MNRKGWMICVGNQQIVCIILIGLLLDNLAKIAVDPYLQGYYDTWLRKARNGQRPFLAVALAFSQQVTPTSCDPPFPILVRCVSNLNLSI